MKVQSVTFPSSSLVCGLFFFRCSMFYVDWQGRSRFLQRGVPVQADFHGRGGEREERELLSSGISRTSN